MKLKPEDILSSIRDDLGLQKKDLNEAFVVADRVFDIKTDKLSEKSIAAHQELLKKYIETLNTVSAELDTANRQDANSNHSAYRSLKIDETFNTNASFLHGMYFDNIGDMHSTITADSLTYMRIERDFGSFDDWQKDFIACAMSARNGWVLTVYNGFLKRYMNVVVDLHSLNVPVNAYPVVVLDMWEHAYYRDYLNDKKAYVFNMMKELNWGVIEKRVVKADKIGKVLS